VRERALAISQSNWVDEDSSYAAPRPARGSFLSRLIRWHLREWLVVLAVAFAVGMVVVNALFLQTGPHPAPIFANHAPPAVMAKDAIKDTPMMLPRPRPAGAKTDLSTPAAPATPVRPRTEIVAEIQRELAKRGFFDGPADGVYGAKTDIAIRDFESATAMQPSMEPNEMLLRSIARSTVKASPAAPANDPIAGLLTPSKRVIALQRALSAYGYGQIKSTGTYDLETRAAIEQFERNRKLPVTGQISDRVTRELASVTGRPLE
jgi:hypothetical protein